MRIVFELPLISSMNMLPVLSFLAGTAEARDLRTEPYHVPTPEEVSEICAASTKSCDAAEVRGECTQERAGFKAQMSLVSDEAYQASHGRTKAEALASWQCSTTLLDETSCTWNIPEKLPADRNGDGRLSFHEAVAKDVTAAAGLFGYEEDFKEPYLLELRADFMASYIPLLTESTFCPVDLNKDGVISAKDDVDGNGTIDNRDRTRYARLAQRAVQPSF